MRMCMKEFKKQKTLQSCNLNENNGVNFNN